MSNNIQTDQTRKPAKLHNEKEYLHFSDGTTEIIRTVERGDNPTTGEPITITHNYQQSDDWCANPFDLHPPMRITFSVTGDKTNSGTPLCYQYCHPQNDKNIKFNKMWAFFWFRKKIV